MSEDKSGKRRWTDPIVLVPIITAIIAAIHTYVLLIRPAIEETQSPTAQPTSTLTQTPEPTLEPTPTPPESTPTTPKTSATPPLEKLGQTLAGLLSSTTPTPTPTPDDATETTSEPTPSPPPEPTPSADSITVGTDKESYTIGEIVTISGNVSKPESGKSLRIDVYTPTGDILLLANAIKVYPNGRGFYTHDLHTGLMAMGNVDGQIIPGKYEVLVNYLNQSAKDTFDLE